MKQVHCQKCVHIDIGKTCQKCILAYGISRCCGDVDNANFTFTATRHLDPRRSSTFLPETLEPLKTALLAFATMVRSCLVGFRSSVRRIRSDPFPTPRMSTFAMWHRGHGNRPMFLIVARRTLVHECAVSSDVTGMNITYFSG